MTLSPDNRRMIDAWHAVALSGDNRARDALFHDDAVFESPVVHTPQRGKAITTKYLTSAAATFADSQFEYVGEWGGERSIVLEFICTIDGIAMNGIDMISYDEAGLITHFKVMVRPLKAVNLLHAKMGAQLAAL